MTNRAQDIALGISLLLIAGVWTWLVIETIPPGFGEGEIGARAFPLTFGVMLIGLAALLLVRLWMQSDIEAKEGVADAEMPEVERLHLGHAVLVLVQIVIYGILLEKIGFVLATPLVILAVMGVSMGVRSLRKLLGMSLGLTVGCWVIFEKVMGIYLANGTWMNLG